MKTGTVCVPVREREVWRYIHTCREQLEQEVRHVREEVEVAEKQLVSLRRENRKTMLVSVFIFALLIALYYLFTLAIAPQT